MARKKQRRGRKPKALRITVLEQAIADVSDREGTYGPPLDNHLRVATLMLAWRQISPHGIGPLDSIIFQIMTNVARIAQTPGYKGSWDNIAGYAAIGYEVTNQ